ncbi:YphA family membrane protein [Bacillus sp. FSL K6-3431]|uniref:YphA family membrane protein n=1 Tax=Bacillus sp. FSL K6-3431 TaxID=2921500 RepID=UPI0030F72BD2
MDGLVTLFLLWSVWIYATFIMDKREENRLSVAVLALLLIITTPLLIPAFSVTISCSIFILLLINYYIASKLPLLKKTYLVFSVIALMFGYSGFQLLEMYDPIWVFFDRRVFLSIIFLFFSYLIYPLSLKWRFILICLGSIHGEILFAIIISRWNMPYLIGTAVYFDIICVTFICLLGAHGLVKLVDMLTLLNKKKIQQ